MRIKAPTPPAVPGRLQFPTSSAITDADGNLTPVWRAYFEHLYLRTGGSTAPPFDLTSLAAALAAEREARIAADALLVPIAQLCSLWAQCNLLFLPPTDPGGGKPWLDPGFPAPAHLAVGTPPDIAAGMMLEDASGDWALEDASGHWIWG